VKAPFPGFVEPPLATSIEKVPSGHRWVHEVKFDGYRVQVHLVNEAVKIFTRRGHDWTKRFRKVDDDAWHIGAGSAIIDGEIVVPAADGTTDFSVLQSNLFIRWDKAKRGSVPRQVRRGKGPPSPLQGPTGGPVTEHPATIWDVDAEQAGCRP